MNITDMSVTPLHKAFDEVSRAATARGIRVSGTEIVGLIPKKALIDAGKHYLRLQHRSVGISEKEIIHIAVKSMGLDELRPFNPEEKVIEYMLDSSIERKRLVDKTCVDFADETASESPAPGGGSIAAYMGALAAALGTMVANLSAHKAGWDERWEEFSDVAEKGRSLQDQLIALVDEDTVAFNKIMAVFAMPKNTEDEKTARKFALEKATMYATEVPFKTMKVAFETFEILQKMTEIGNPASVSDAGVGALAAKASVLGAYLNVRINASGLKNREYADKLLAEARLIVDRANKKESEILELVNKTIDG